MSKNQIIKEYLESQGYTYLKSEEDFNIMYPPTKWGFFRPQPWERPESYPCMMLELYIDTNSSGADDAIVSILPLEVEL